MDKMIFTAAQGANRIMQAQSIRANNLANADTPGFRADLERVQSQKIDTVPDTNVTRILPSTLVSGFSNRQGMQNETGRPLDVAINGDGFFAVETEDGEGYTRHGGFEVNAAGQLTLGGYPAVGAGGPLVLPPYASLFINSEGVISIQAEEGGLMEPVGQLKLVQPENGVLEKGKNGMFYAAEGEAVEAAPLVRVRSGVLEGSNVEAISELIATMDLGRQFEVQVKLMKSAEKLAEVGNTLLRNS